MRRDETKAGLFFFFSEAPIMERQKLLAIVFSLLPGAFLAADTKKNAFVVKAHSEMISAIAFSSDRSVLATGSFDSTAILWDAATGKKRAVLSAQRGPFAAKGEIAALAFSPDAKLLATGSWDGAIILWDVLNGNARTTIQVKMAKVTALAFSPDGKVLASGGSDNTIRIWNPASGRQLSALA